MRYIQEKLSNYRDQESFLPIVPIVKAPLSARETEVLILMCQENSSKQIAHLLNISPETVNTHKKALRKKTGSFTEVGVVIFAVKNHLFLFAIILSHYEDMINCCYDGIINC